MHVAVIYLVVHPEHSYFEMLKNTSIEICNSFIPMKSSDHFFLYFNVNYCMIPTLFHLNQVDVITIINLCTKKETYCSQLWFFSVLWVRICMYLVMYFNN